MADFVLSRLKLPILSHSMANWLWRTK